MHNSLEGIVDLHAVAAGEPEPTQVLPHFSTSGIVTDIRRESNMVGVHQERLNEFVLKGRVQGLDWDIIAEACGLVNGGSAALRFGKYVETHSSDRKNSG